MTAYRFTLAMLALAFAVSCTSYDSPALSSTAPTPVGSSTTSAAPLGSRNVSAAATVATPSTASVEFGQGNVGSPFSPTSGHDQSAHAEDNLVPRTVVIDAGGTVTFKTFGVHQVAIYDSGTTPEDIDTTDLVLTPANCPQPMGDALMIDDDTNRLALFAQPCGPNPREVEYQFMEPGRYLVICAFLPHFEVQMYGWVEVRDR